MKLFEIMGKQNQQGQFDLGFQFKRNVNGKPEVVDVSVTFDGHCSAKGEKQSWDSPGWAPEYETEVKSVTFDPPNLDPQEIAELGGPLTPQEIQQITKWFYDNKQDEAGEKIEQYENDKAEASQEDYDDSRREEREYQKHNPNW